MERKQQLEWNGHVSEIELVYRTRLIKMAGLLREVNFRRLPGQAAAYHVDTTDERGTRFLFTVVRQEEGGWKLVSPSLPDWIEAAEGLLSAAIGEQEAGAEEEGKRTT